MAKTKTVATRPSTEATAIELFAMHVAAKAAEKVRDQLEEGSKTAVDVELRVKGMVQVGLGETRETTVKPELVNLVGLMLEFSDAGQRKRLEKKLDSAYSLADAECGPECCAEMRILAEKAIARWSKKKEQERRGAVTGVVTVEVLARHGEEL